MWFLSGVLLGCFVAIVLSWFKNSYKRQLQDLIASGLILKAAGDRLGATRVYLQVFRRSPMNIVALENLHAAVENGESNLELLEAFQFWSVRNPTDARVRYDLGCLLVRQGDVIAAHEQWKQVLSLDATGGWAYRAREMLNMYPDA